MAKIHHLLVISPTLIGRTRLKRFKKHIASYPGSLPSLVHIAGADKNLVNFKEFKHCIIDNKDWLTKVKLILGIEKYQFNFGDKSDYFTELKGKHNQKWPSGTICCALSHLEAWEFVAKAPGLCLILEDDAFIKYDVDFSNIPLPCEDVDLITILKTKIYCYKQYSETYLELITGKVILANGKVKKNHGLSGYFLSPKGAEKLLQMIVPLNSGIDMELYRLAQYDSIKMFSTKEDWVIDMGTKISLIKTKKFSIKHLKVKLRNAKK